MGQLLRSIKIMTSGQASDLWQAASRRPRSKVPLEKKDVLLALPDSDCRCPDEAGSPRLQQDGELRNRPKFTGSGDQGMISPLPPASGPRETGAL